jgi:hypothetical protein
LKKLWFTLGYADSTFVPDEVFDEQTSKMLNTLYIDYGIDTKSEITPTEQVLINQKQDEIELLENTVSDWWDNLKRSKQ